MKGLFLLTLSSVGVLSQYGPYADLLLSLSDQQLFKASQNKRTGACFIYLCQGDDCVCDMYAKVTTGSTTSTGLPDLIGTGCIVSPDWPKGTDTCWGPPNTYQNYASEICTENGVTNAANMIRIGIKKGYCKLPSCQASVPIFTPVHPPVDQPINPPRKFPKFPLFLHLYMHSSQLMQIIRQIISENMQFE